LDATPGVRPLSRSKENVLPLLLPSSICPLKQGGGSVNTSFFVS
jgi:hypothetical protein